MAKIEFTAKIQYVDPSMGGWAQIVFPKQAAGKLGTKARVAIRGTVNGFPIRTSAFPTGSGTHQFMTNKAMLECAKAAVGDRVEVAVEVDDQPRPVKIPAELKRALAGSRKAKTAFDEMPPSHRREIAGFVSEAKKTETRAQRAQQTVEKLASGTWESR